MRYGIISVAIIALLAKSVPAIADYAKGLDAYEIGDYSTALKEWRSLAEQGDIRAQTMLGFIYRSGKGVLQDHETAVKWFTFAAEKGSAKAQTALAIHYMQGEGVEQNTEIAIEWNTRAAEQGFAPAQYNLGNTYLHGKGVERDDKSAFKWMKLAAEHEKMTASRTVLGVMYWKGWGTEPNPIRAYMWLSIAMPAGDEVANQMQAKLEKQMTASQLEAAQQLEMECIAKDYKDC